jgi:hypothetical protein
MEQRDRGIERVPVADRASAREAPLLGLEAADRIDDVVLGELLQPAQEGVSAAGLEGPDMAHRVDARGLEHVIGGEVGAPPRVDLGAGVSEDRRGVLVEERVEGLPVSLTRSGQDVGVRRSHD